MTDTTITDPSGFLPSTKSTPHDLVLLGEAALKDPVLAGIVQLESATIPVEGTIRNVNVLLGYQGIVGIKTGNNDQDPGCFLFASKQAVGTSTVMIIGVVMNGSTLGKAMWAALPLIRSAVSNFSEVTVVHAGDAVGTYVAPWQPAVSAVASQDLTLVTWSSIPVTAHLSLQDIHAPAGNGTQVGLLTAVSNTRYKLPIVLKQAIHRPNVFWRLTHPVL